LISKDVWGLPITLLCLPNVIPQTAGCYASQVRNIEPGPSPEK
jgi:hypothetical protein